MSAASFTDPSGLPRSIGKKFVPMTQMECCIEGCGAKFGQVNVSFHRFPTTQTARDALRRELWIQAAGLPNSKIIIDNAIICGLHFEKGKPSLPTDVGSPNWAPTLKLNTKKAVSLGPTSTVSIESAVSDSTAMTMNTQVNTITSQRLQVPSVPIMGPQIIPKDVHLPTYCRLCLAEDVLMVFPKDSKVYHQLADKLKECLNLEISIEELAISMICKKCHETVEQLQQFRARCARQNTYLNMRKSLEPDRNHLLRYKDNWYWYSCLGNGMNSVIWGCSVVCCPAFVVSHPSGKICSKFANHQHKQKMEDVKAVYCHGEYIFDGYRYSFEVINSNRTLTFSCRSLHDPHRTCPALLITNDRSEVLHGGGGHNHEREIIIESAVKDGSDGVKRSITIIRGISREIVFCQGFWYTTISEQSNISHWNCIRYDCSSTIAMVNGVVKFYGTHTHLPVLMKWGAEEDKTMEIKGPTLMKVVKPTCPKTMPVRSVPPVASRESTTIVHSRHSGIVSTARISESEGNVITNPQSTIEDGPLWSTIKVEPARLANVSINPLNSTTIVRPSAPINSLPNQPNVISASTMAPNAANSSNVFVRSNHPIQVLKRTAPTIVRVVPPPLQKQPTPLIVPPRPSVPATGPTIPKIVHVMSLNLNHSSNQPKQTTTPEVPAPKLMSKTESDDDSQQVIKQEPVELIDEPETITDEVRPATVTSAPSVRRIELPKPPPLTPRPMLLVSSASVVSDNMLSVTTLDPACIDGSMRAVPEVSTAVSYGNGDSSQETVSVEQEEEHSNYYFSPNVLKGLLQKTVFGSDILKNANELDLPEASKKFVTDIIARHHLETKKKTTDEQLEVYADVILKIFPKETKATYFIPKGNPKGNPGGKLFSRINYLRQSERKREREEEEHLIGAQHAKSIKMEIPHEAISALEWLQLNRSPWSTVITQWELSFNVRKEDLRKYDQSSEVLQTFPHLFAEYGYQLDCLNDLQDDEDIPPIVPIDADLEQRIVGNEYSTRVLPNGRTQVVRKVILSRGSTTEWTGNQRVIHSTRMGQRPSIKPGNNGKPTVAKASGPAAISVDLTSDSLDREKTTRKYGPSSGAQKRISEVVEIESSTTKKTKANEPVAALETSIVDAEKYTELADPAEDPIAVSIEPHQNIQSDHGEDDDNDDDDGDGDDNDGDDNDEKEDEDEDRSSIGQKTNTESENDANAETLVNIRSSTENPPEQTADSPVSEQTAPSTEKAPEQTADSPVSEQTAPVQPQASKDPSVNQSDKKTHSKTVQLVKLQKTEQMLSHEGHLYKIKWHNRRRIYWDCMLREQVNCMAILETQKNKLLWNKIGSHNHKIPKPIINKDNRGRYQMLTNDISAVNVKNLPYQTLQIDDIEEKEGRMMNLAKRKMFNFKIRKVNDEALLTLYFANYEYEIINIVGPGFRWKCTTCSHILETDEKFTVAQELGSKPHNHEPKLTVINLVDEGPLAGSSKTADASESSSSSRQQSPHPTPTDVDETNSGDQDETVDEAPPVAEGTKPATPPEQEANAKCDESSDCPKLPSSKSDSDAEDNLRSISEEMFADSFTGELGKTAELREDGSDDEEMVLDQSTGQLCTSGDLKRKAYRNAIFAEDGSDEEEMVLDPSTGELCKSGELKRKEYRKAILEDIVADDDDDEAEYLDPLTGKLRRKGDQSLSEDEDLENEGDGEGDESPLQSKTSNIPSEDFEELLNPDPKDSSGAKKRKRPKKNSLAALKLILTLHKQLRLPDPERNFEVLPSTDNATCLIRFNEFTYELDTVQDTFSVWKCNLSPQYACRGKVHLDLKCREISVSGVNHCHVATLKDIFIDRPGEEDGRIKDTDYDSTREYTFYKRPHHTYQLKLDDGYLYNCITISKTGVSCWRCVSRQMYNCKAIITMEGDFESMTRNRFSHSHDPVPSEGAAVDAEEADDAEEKDRSLDSPVAPAKRASKNENEDDRKKKQRQTL